MTKMPKLHTTVGKSFPEKGYGFFVHPGLPDLKFQFEQMLAAGFEPNRLKRGQPAVIDGELYRNRERQLKARVIAIYEVNGQPAGSPIVVAKPASEAVIEVEPDIEVETEDRRQIGVVHEGDLVRAKFKVGFDGRDGRMPNFGFLTPVGDHRFGGRDIFVYAADLPQNFDQLVAAGELLSVTILSVENGRYSGRVNGRWVAATTSAKQPVVDRVAQQRAAKKEAREQKRQEILARPKMTFEHDGRTLASIPVEGDEWHCLPEGTAVLQLESGTPQRGFIVAKPGGTPQMSKRLEPVTLVTPEVAKKRGAYVEPLGIGVFLVADATVTAKTFKVTSRDEAKVLQRLMVKHGLSEVGIADGKGNFVLGRTQKDSDKLLRLPAELITLVNEEDDQAA